MAKRKATRRMSSVKRAKKRTATKRSSKRPTRKAAPRRHARATPKRAGRRRPAAAKRARGRKATTSAARRAEGPVIRASGPSQLPRKRHRAPKKSPRLDRVRRTLDDTVPTPPSSLDMERRGSAARTGRAEIAEHLHNHSSMTPAITAGDVDVDVEDAYFTGDEVPGGDNPTPDQDVVDEIGKALGVQYDDNEELKASEKIVERDKHRWEMDPASSEDYKDRK